MYSARIQVFCVVALTTESTVRNSSIFYTTVVLKTQHPDAEGALVDSRDVMTVMQSKSFGIVPMQAGNMY